MSARSLKKWGLFLLLAMIGAVYQIPMILYVPVCFIIAGSATYFERNNPE